MPTYGGSTGGTPGRQPIAQNPPHRVVSNGGPSERIVRAAGPSESMRGGERLTDAGQAKLAQLAALAAQAERLRLGSNAGFAEFFGSVALTALFKSLSISAFRVTRGPERMVGTEVRTIDGVEHQFFEPRPGRLGVKIDPTGVGVGVGQAAAELGLIGTTVHAIRATSSYSDALKQLLAAAGEIGLELRIDQGAGEFRFVPVGSDLNKVSTAESAAFLDAALVAAYGLAPAAGEADIPAGRLVAGPLDPTWIPASCLLSRAKG